MSNSHQDNWNHPLLGIALVIICLVTIAGNCLVVAAVYMVRSVCSPNEFYVVSLAFADLIVGMVVMPLNGLFEMTGHVWLLGLAMCDIFHAMDILASTSSIWSLCVIAVDRYIAGSDPLRYRNIVSKKRILTAILLIWLFSAGLSFPAVILWRHTSPHLYVDNSKCIFTDNKFYIIFSSTLSFYVPMLVLLFAYGKVLIIATHHSRSLKSGIKKFHKKGSESVNVLKLNMDSNNYPTMRIHRGRTEGKCISKNLSKSSHLDAIHLQHAKKLRMLSAETEEQLETRRSAVCLKRSSDYNTKYTSDRCEFLTQTLESNMSSFFSKSGAAVREKSRQMRNYVHERRAARTLFVVVGVFILCWTPFFIFSPIITFCNTCFGDHELIYSLSTWAGHLNSLLNPIIYSRFSRKYRRAFRQILTCGQRKRNQKPNISNRNEKADAEM